MEWLSEQSADDGCRVERRQAWDHRKQRWQDSIEFFVSHDPRVRQDHARQQRGGWQPRVRLFTDGVIIVGHTRFKAARKLNLDEVPVHVATDLEPEAVKAYRIADNRTGENAEWDWDLLPIEIGELQQSGFDCELLGFDDVELAKLLDPGVLQGLTDPEEVPEPPDEAVTQPGDVWILGDHRLLCGDSSKAEDVDRLLAGAKIHLVNTRPHWRRAGCICRRQLSGTRCTRSSIEKTSCLIGSDEGHACDMLESIKTELDGNDLLLADYPEVCFPIQALDGIANRANGQLHQGKRTQIGWTAKEVVLPSIESSKARGAIIKVAGLTGRIRGMKFKRPDGKTVRPSLVVLDDPQTDESARSLSQCANREAILAGAVLGLAGPGKKISGIMPCTIIRPGDMADNILDRDKHPEWNGSRTRMVNSFPTNETLWERYAEIRSEGLRAGDGGAAGTEFYRKNKAAMDEGADVAWKERFNHDELSAIQHAMNLKLQDEAAFFAEYQNEPLPAETVDADQLTAEYFIKTEGRGRTVDEWKARPEQPDNHWLDCLVGTAVAGSMQGALLFGTDLLASPKRERVSFRDLQRRKKV